jgi:iron complex outermembrane receptor protein
MRINRLRGALLATTLLSLGAATQASAQNAGAPTPTPPAPSATTGPVSPAGVSADQSAQDNTDNTPIVVTGTLFRRTDRETPSPVTVLTADNLAKRGVNTISDAISLLSANGSGNLPNGFSAGGGAFANGASSVSLRGLTTDSTLVLFDGLRATYYPLSDDGTRNFVDLNTIPDSIVDRVEVLKDGASSTYGADAVAGVVNLIVKRQITGFQGTVEGGISQRGDGDAQRITATWGHGDLKSDGYNFYLNAEYQRDAPIYLRDRSYPFNSGDYSRFSSVDAEGNPIYGVNLNPNGLKGDGTFGGTVGATIVPVVRPATATGGDIRNGVAVAGSSWQLLNPAAGCGHLIQHNVGNGFGTLCEQDLIKDYQEAQSQTTRFGTTAHGTVQLNDTIQAYAMFTYYQDKVFHTGAPISIRRQTNTGDFDSNTIVLPAVLTAGANAGQLNPNDPFAAAGLDALIRYRFADLPTQVTSLSRSYRGATGIDGSFGAGWNFNAEFTGMATTLDTTQKGYIYGQGLLDVINDGSYNFVDPSQNTPETLARLSPTNKSRASSKLYQGQANISKDLFDLPGGPLQVAVGGAVRYESLDDPSANPDDAANPANQYFTINGFGAIGHRYVESGFFEINAPVLRILEINGSGRYDHYSTGFSNFSPKIGAKFTPIKELALRGTFSKGFRVPSFAESNALPTIGFSSAPTPDAFTSQHLDASGKPDAYTQYMIGLNTSGTPGLKPEKSTSFTGGFVAQPTRWLSLTADYYHIKKTDVIVGADPTAAIAAYYNGDAIPTGFSITPDTQIDDLHPDAIRRVFAVNYGFVNAAKIITSGIDVEATAQIPLADNIKFTSSFSGTYVINYNLTTADGQTQRYAGTLGPCNITSCSGSPKFRANWQNTLDFDRYSITGTAYYTSGYKTTAEDVGGAGTRNDCSTIEGTHAFYDDGSTPVQCHVKHFIDFDLTGSVRVNDKFTFYVNVINVFDAKPPLDFVTYGQNMYNPAWSQQGIVGRYFRAGVNFKL